MPSLRSIALGQVRVRIHGAHIERVINAASRQGVVLRGVQREGSKALTCSMTYQEFFALRSSLSQLNCRVRILSRFGLPHVRSRLRARMLWPVGALACLILLMWLTQMVWGVQIVGGESLDAEQLSQALGQAGIRMGMLRTGVDADAVDAAIRERFADISIVTTRMRGLTLEVEIVPLQPQPEIFDRDTPVDIVAAFDGVIERVIALEGRAVVQPGQQVKRGDVLIEGVVIAPGGEMQVHAMGETLARVWVEGEGSASLIKEMVSATGNYQNRTMFWILDRWMPIHPDPPYADYQIASRETELLPGLYLPAGVRRETVYEMQVSLLPRDEEEAKREAQQAAIQQALAKLPQGSAIVDKWVEYGKIKETELTARVGLQSIQPIGEERLR